jgi:hypothetical protein
MITRPELAAITAKAIANGAPVQRIVNKARCRPASWVYSRHNKQGAPRPRRYGARPHNPALMRLAHPNAPRSIGCGLGARCTLAGFGWYGVRASHRFT